MAMPFRIVLYATNEVAASDAAHAAFARIRELNLVFSDYEDVSELTRLSKMAGQGRAVELSEDLWRVLSLAEDMSRRSDGAFDVTIGPVVQLWRRARRQRELPAPERLAEARAAVGWQKLVLDRKARTAELLAPRMRLDLGGIAKGYALDAALAVLRTNGIRRALVSGGGDMALGDPPPDRPGWRIEVPRLNLTNAPPEQFVLLANAGLATSGDLYQRVIIAGVRYSHIVDPRTGIGLTDHSQVTVIARDATTADALATTVSVLGPEQGLELVESTCGAAVQILRQPESDVEARTSRRWERLLHRPMDGEWSAVED
jgi:thiamine biosynthesis lipoprotein